MSGIGVFVLCRRAALLLSVASFIPSSAAQEILVGAWNGHEARFASDRVVLGFARGVAEDSLLAELEAAGLPTIAHYPRLRIAVLRVAGESAPDRVATDLTKDARIAWSEPDFVLEPALLPPPLIPTDPLFANQWHFHNTGQTGGPPDVDIDGPEAWGVTLGSLAVTVLIADSGISLQAGTSTLNHPDLDETSRFVLGTDFTGDGNGVRDGHYHGTAMAGFAGADWDGVGLVGVAPGARFHVSQVFTVSTTYYPPVCAFGLASWFAGAVNEAIANGIRVLTYCGCGIQASAALEAAVAAAAAADVLITSPTGNDGLASQVWYPAAYAGTYGNVVSTGATNHLDNRSGLSNYSSTQYLVTLAAPGGAADGSPAHAIWTTTPPYPVSLPAGCSAPPSGWTYGTGTSAAAPQAAGAAALVLSLNPNLLATQVRTILEDGAEQVGAGVVYDPGTGMSHELGHGRLNLANSLARVPRLGPAGTPSVGNAAFGIEVTGIAGSGYVLVLSTSPLDPPVPIPPFGYLAVANFVALGGGVVAAGGASTFSLPVPNAPNLVGAVVLFQGLLVHPDLTAVTNRLTVVVVP
jgi:thermitase